MTSQQDFQKLVDSMPSLALAVSRLIEQQEKSWGCFQIKKGEDKIYRLYIPSLPILQLKASSNHLYRAFWGNNNRSSVYTKQNKKNLTLTKSELAKIHKNQSQTKQSFQVKTKDPSPHAGSDISTAETSNKKRVILSSSRKASRKSVSQTELVTMRQNIYEIVYYRSSATPEIDLINQMIAGFLREKIENMISESSLAPNEIRPLILVTAKN